MQKYVLAIDQGTTSTRSILFDKQCNIISRSQIEHEQIFPQPGWVEHNPVEILNNTYHTMLEVIEKKQIKPEQIVSIGITNQRETTILWDRLTGEPIHNAIVWQDDRTNKLVNDYIKSKGDDFFRQRTGLPISSYFSALKIRWLIENITEARDLIHKNRLLFGNIDSWLIWNLTGGTQNGVHITDVSNASRTLLMNLETLAWDDDILDFFDIPKSILPIIRPSIDSGIYGYSQVNNPYPIEIPICGAIGDQQAATLGQACLNKGDSKNTYGTGCFIMYNTDEEIIYSKHGLLTTVYFQMNNDPPKYALEGSIANTGSLVQWLRDNLNLIDSSEEIELLANKVKDNGDVYIVPAFSGLLAPHWRSDARGIIMGITRYTNKNHIARAALESTAFQTKEIIDSMNKEVGVDLTTLKVDGGMVSNDLLMQFQADILNCNVIRPKISETTSLGAAFAAGLAIGYWEDIDEIRNIWLKEKQWSPTMSTNKIETYYSKWKQTVEKSLNWIS